MKKKAKLNIFSSLLVPLTLSIFSIPTIINNINSSTKLLNENTKINQPSQLTISQHYRIEPFTFNETSNIGEHRLLNKNNPEQIKNPLFEFAKDLNSNEYLRNTIAIDLNTWKPIGMSDDIFLKSLQFDIDGYINFDTNIKPNETTAFNKSQRIIDYNINENSFFKDIEYDKDNFQNLYVKENTKTTKLVSNLLIGNSKTKYGDTISGFCFLTFEVEHQKPKDNSSLNRLLITPKIEYAWESETTNYQTTVPSQEITFTFKSSLFNYDLENQISIDSYVSDNFALDASNGQDSTSSQLDTTTGNNSIIFSSKKDNNPDLGQVAPLSMKEIEIDTSNFYLDDSNNHKDDNFKISMEGITLSEAVLNVVEKDGSTPNSNELTRVVNFINQNKDIKIEFNVNDNEFISNNQIVKTISIFDNLMLSENDQKTFGSQPSGLYLNLTIEKKADFKYTITKMEFKGIKSFFNLNNKFYTCNVRATVESSSEVIVKTTPLDFSFTRMNKSLIENVMRNDYLLQSQYSSNVFDDTFFNNISDYGNQTNYQKAYLEIEKRFVNAIRQSQDWQIALGLQSIDNLNINNYFNNPFIKTNYTGSVSDFRTKGQMSLRYSSKNSNKYFKYLNLYFNVAINNENQSTRKEIISLSFNNSENNKLDQYASQYTNINQLITYLNSLNDPFKKYELFNLINQDSFDSFSSIVFDIKFQYYSKNQIKAIITLKGKYLMVNSNLLLTNQIELISKELKVKTYQEKAILSLNENLIIERAKLANDYNDFKNQNNDLAKALDLINLTFSQEKDKSKLVQSIQFLDTPNFLNRIIIKVILNDGYYFNNNTNEQIISLSNINWKNQNNQVKPIAVALNYEAIGQKILQFTNQNDFLETMNKMTKEEIKYFFDFSIPTDSEDNQVSNINQIYSIKFEATTNSNKIKVVLVANEWFYFEYPSSNQRNGTREFIISNINWKNQEKTPVIETNIYLQEILFIQELIKYYDNWKINNQNNEINFFNDFINEKVSSFFKDDDNYTSYLRINPIENSFYCTDYVNIIAKNNGIYINLELNEGYYLKNSSLNKDYARYITTFEKFISIDDIKSIYEKLNDPNNESFVDLSYSNFNLTKLEKDAKEYENINDFIRNKLNSEYQILQYVDFDNQHQDNFSKIEKLEVKTINKNQLNITIKLFDGYYYKSSLNNETTFSFQLIFKNDNFKLSPIFIDLNRDNFVLKVKDFETRDQMIEFYKNKNQYSDFKEFIMVNDNEIKAIEQINLISGLSLNTIIIKIKLKAGYYFIGYPQTQLILDLQINNLLFKNDPPYDQVFTKVDIKIKGNNLLLKAKEFNNINQFIKFLYQNNNWQNYLEVITSSKEDSNPIFSFNIYQKNYHKMLIKLTLKEGYYHSDQHYTQLEKEYVVGNLYFKNEEIPKLKNIDVKFNSKKFYNLTKDLKDKNWNSFLNLISPELMNFKDANNAILWTNTRKQEIYKIINVKVENNQLILILELDNGYYFDDNDQSNSRIQLNYDSKTLNDYYYLGIKKISDAKIKQNWIIALSITLPFLGLFIIAAIYIIKSKRKAKKEELGEV